LTRSEVEELRGRLRFFHWPLGFPEAIAVGGFDCVIGNPPWEVLQLNEEEYFAARSPSIAALPGARRKAAINALEIIEPTLWRVYRHDLRLVEATNQFIRENGLYELTARGKLNTYALFAEAFLRLTGPRGRAGLIVPTGIATDDGNKLFFAEVVRKARLVALLGFDNQRRIFASVHPDTPFALITFGDAALATRYSFYILAVEHLADERRMFSLSAADIALINPNTRTCPVFRSSADAELTKRIFASMPVLMNEGTGAAGNPWGITFRQGLLNMTTESGLFRTAHQLVEAGGRRYGADWQLSDGTRMVPLYEAKMIHQFDHRWATFDSDKVSIRDVMTIEKENQNYAVMPRYWVPKSEVNHRLTAKGWRNEWLAGWRFSTNPTNERTMIASAFPACAAPYMFPLFLTGPMNGAYLLGIFGSFAFDYLLRQKMSRQGLDAFILKQVAVPPPNSIHAEFGSFLLPRILELTYTAYDMRPWAEDLGYDGPPFGWDEDRRAHLRADLDAAYAHLCGLTRDELRYILDPADIYGPDFPSETFCVLKEREMRQYDEYRTARLVLAAWDRLTADGTFGGFQERG
jgi:hypothetical protein